MCAWPVTPKNNNLRDTHWYRPLQLSWEGLPGQQTPDCWRDESGGCCSLSHPAHPPSPDSVSLGSLPTSLWLPTSWWLESYTKANQQSKRVLSCAKSLGEYIPTELLTIVISRGEIRKDFLLTHFHIWIGLKKSNHTTFLFEINMITLK